MADIRLPYGRESLLARIPEGRLAGILTSSMHAYRAGKSESELVREALEHPVGSPKLSELAKGKDKVLVIASDHTRPVPSRIIMPGLLSEIRKGNPDADITILIATGCHRETKREEIEEKFGSEIAGKEKIVVHDCDDTEQLSEIGILPSGGRLVVNSLVAESDLVVAEGFIEPHFFAGFSGGRKSVLPGIASRETVMYNHNAGFIQDACARTGILEGNPIHRDMIYAARKAGLAFICNVVINSEKKIVHAVAGDVEKAHLEGCRFVSRMCGAEAVPSDIVITTNGGYPLDQNIYQAVKGMTAAEATVRKGGVIIMLAKSADGHGGESFYRTFRDESDVERMMEGFLRTPPEKTIVDQWQSQIFARVLSHADVIYISDAPDEMVRSLHMIPAHSVEEAIGKADLILRERGITDGKILVIPDGVSVIINSKD